MSQFSTGLTRIKGNTEDNLSSIGRDIQVDQLQSDNIVGNKNTKLLAEVNELLRTRDSLVKEISDLAGSKINVEKQITSEIYNLTRSKVKLVEEVRALGKIFSILKEAKDKGETNLNKFLSDREDVLVEFSSLLSSSLDRRAKLLKVRADSLVKDEGEVSEMYDYSENLLEAAQIALHEVGKAKSQLQVEAKESLVLKESARKDSQWAAQKVELAKSRLVNAIGVELSAKESLRIAQKEVKRITATANKMAKTVHLKDLEVSTRDKFLDEKEKSLAVKELRLKDKEETLKRSAYEISLKAQKLGIVL